MLIPTGLGQIVTAMYQREGRDLSAAGSLAAGTFLVVMGALHYKILEAELPGGGGMKLAREGPDVTARIGVESNPPPPEAVGPNEEDDATRWVLATYLFEELLGRPKGPLEECSLQLYLHDEERELLLPILAPGHPGLSPGFAPGQGATGTAWQTEEYVVAEGPAVADDTFRLSPEQQERYRDLAAVAAMPVTNTAGKVIGVLSAASRDPGGALLSAVGFEQHVFLAEAAARILIDLLKWFDDTYDESK